MVSRKALHDLPLVQPQAVILYGRHACLAAQRGLLTVFRSTAPMLQQLPARFGRAGCRTAYGRQRSYCVTIAAQGDTLRMQVGMQGSRDVAIAGVVRCIGHVSAVSVLQGGGCVTGGMRVAGVCKGAVVTPGGVAGEGGGEGGAVGSCARLAFIPESMGHAARSVPAAASAVDLVAAPQRHKCQKTDLHNLAGLARLLNASSCKALSHSQMRQHRGSKSIGSGSWQQILR